MEKRLFTDRELMGMLAPLVLDQLLVRVVGLADSFIISFTGEEAVSGVALIDNFNLIFQYVFLALSSGGAVVVSQYLGRGDKERATEAMGQLLMLSTLSSVVMTVPVLISRSFLINLFFGRIDEGVFSAAVVYMRISVLSFPALAVYNAGASLYRSIGRTHVTMNISVLSNVINLVGNIIGVFVLRKGVLGVAYPTLIARTFSAAAVTVLAFRRPSGTGYRLSSVFAWEPSVLKRISRIALPNALESGVFQLVKVGTSSIVALSGTSQIAANGIAQTFWSLSCLLSIAAGPVFTTVIGQCMGKGDKEAASWYMRHLLKITLLLSVLWNLVFFLVAFPVLGLYAVSEETRRLTWVLIVMHNIGNAILFPFYEPLGKGLRAAGDVRYTLLVSLFTSIGVRLVMAFLLGAVLGWGVIGVAISMILDWLMRSSLFLIRLRSGKWLSFKVI